MAAWTYIVMAILAVAIGIFVFLTLSTESQNAKQQQSNILVPFSGYLAPSSKHWSVNKSKNNVGTGANPEDGLYLVGMVGGKGVTTPQIQCPIGSKINVVGAMVEVIDPYGECGATSKNPTLQATCGNIANTSSMPACTDGGNDCGPGMTCFSGRCRPISNCKIHNDCTSAGDTTIQACPSEWGDSCSDACPSGLVCVNSVCKLDPGAGACMACTDGSGNPAPSGGTGVCASMPTCVGVKDGLNLTCESRNTQNNCRPRDASAWLAGYCDGKGVCLGSPDDKWHPNQPGGAFGPLPCQISANSSDNNYLSLPIITGWGGGAPNNSESSIAEPATFRQGYYVHGIYTCVPDDE